ncbi:MAG: DUF655 domain-containing protein, partial [Candidatus Diapherotrites archaeon]|nr:DUF655 domain-containing protein [Candidatus Diapherotrites archaeon]
IGELDAQIEKIIRANEPKFVDFYNNSPPITIRRHQLELLPGVGPKHVQALLTERAKKPFESFTDITARVSAITNPARAIVKRILQELEFDDEKHYLFSRPPPRDKPRFERGFGGRDRAPSDRFR